MEGWDVVIAEERGYNNANVSDRRTNDHKVRRWPVLDHLVTAGGGMSASLMEQCGGGSMLQQCRNIQIPQILVTHGVVSRINVDLNLVMQLQIDAAINPGDSGEPVFDEHGHVVGVASVHLRGAGNI